MSWKLMNVLLMPMSFFIPHSFTPQNFLEKKNEFVKAIYFSLCINAKCHLFNTLFACIRME